MSEYEEDQGYLYDYDDASSSCESVSVVSPQHGPLAWVGSINSFVDSINGQLYTFVADNLSYPLPYFLSQDDGNVYDVYGNLYFSPSYARQVMRNDYYQQPLQKQYQQRPTYRRNTVDGQSPESLAIKSIEETARSVEESFFQPFVPPVPSSLVSEEVEPRRGGFFQEDLPKSLTFGSLTFDALRKKVAEILAQTLDRTVETAAVHLDSDRSSVCTAIMEKTWYVVDTYSGLVFDALPSDIGIVGRAVLARDMVPTINGKISDEAKIVVSHILNARDSTFTMNDYFETTEGDVKIRLGSFHYIKTRGIVPTGQSHNVRGTIVDMEIGVAICNSYGWTPLSKDKEQLSIKKGQLVLMSKDEKNGIVENIFYEGDMHDQEKYDDDNNVVGVRKAPITITPFIEGPLIRVFLSYGKMFVVSHSKIDTSNSRYRNSESLLALFSKYHLTKSILFGDEPNHKHSNFHYNFILRDNAFLSSSRVPVGEGSLVYLGVMYNYNIDPGYCPYEDVDSVTSKPFIFAPGSSIPYDGGVIPITEENIKTGGRLTIFVPKPMSLFEANKHLKSEFGMGVPNSEGSVIIMQKDSASFYTNIVRVIHPKAANRISFIEGANDMEGFLKHVPDCDEPLSTFNSLYEPFTGIIIPSGFVDQDDHSKGDSVKVLMQSISRKANNVSGYKGAIYLEDLLRHLRKPDSAVKKGKGIDFNPTREQRLRVIAVFFIASLPPGRQAENFDILDRYYEFLNTAPALFEANKNLIKQHSTSERTELSKLAMKLKYDASTPKGSRSGKSVVAPPGAKGYLKRAKVGDLIIYYRGYNKIKAMLEIAKKRGAESSSSSSSSAPPTVSKKTVKSGARKTTYKVKQ